MVLKMFESEIVLGFNFYIYYIYTYSIYIIYIHVVLYIDIA